MIHRQCPHQDAEQKKQQQKYWVKENTENQKHPPLFFNYTSL